MRISVTAGAAGAISAQPRVPRGWSGSGAPPQSLGFPGDWYERTNGDYYRRTAAGWGSPLFNRFFAVRAVIGPASAVVDGHVPVWDTTSGQLLRSSGKALPTGAVVGTTDAQTLSNKSLAADATADMHPTTLRQLVAAVSGSIARGSVRVATTGNVTIATALNAGDTIDGVTLVAGDLVLVKSQSAPAENGVYVAGTTPARSSQFDTWDEFPGAQIAVEEGTANADTRWHCTSNRGGTLGTTAITWVQLRVAGELLAANNLSELADPSTARANLGVTIGTHVQAYNANLAAWAGLTLARNRLPVPTGVAALELVDVAPYGLYGRRALGLPKRPNVPQRNYLTGAAWISSTSAADNDWVGIAWSPTLGLFAAVAITGTGNRVMTSPDGITWTARTSAADNDWRSVCWAEELGLFVAVAISGTGNRVMTSPDGITWTARTSAADNDWGSVCWSPELGLLVAVATTGTGNRVMTSPDGITWTIRTSAADNAWRSVCWAAEIGLFVAVATSGTGNRVMTSPDGITWTARTPAADNQWRGVCWAPERRLLVAVGDSGTGNRVMTSPDGITWTARTSAADNAWQRVCWAAEIGLFLAVATGGTNRIAASPDGLTWTAYGAIAANTWQAVCWAPDLGLFCAVSNSGTGNRVMTSVSTFKYPYRS